MAFQERYSVLLSPLGIRKEEAYQQSPQGTLDSSWRTSLLWLGAEPSRSVEEAVDTGGFPPKQPNGPGVMNH